MSSCSLGKLFPYLEGSQKVECSQKIIIFWMYIYQRCLIAVCLLQVLTCPANGSPIPEVSSISEALSRAMVDHPSLRARQAEVTAASTELDQARWQFWPTPSISVQQPNKALIHGTDRSVTLMSLRQPLWTGGRLQAGVALAGAKHQSMQAVRNEARRDVALEVVQAWGEACASARRVGVYESSLQAHLRFVEQIQRRTTAGLSVQSDVELARSRLESVKADLASAQSAQQTALQKLRTLVGQTVNAPQWPQTWLQSGFDVELMVQDSLQLDPTLLRLKSETAELQAQVQANQSAFWPDLYASITERRGDITGRSTQVAVGFESKWGAGLSNVSAVKAANQRLQAKQEDMEYRSRKLQEQIRSDATQLQAVRTRMQVFKQALEAANQVAQSWDRQFAAGKKSWQDVMNAARESTQTELQLVDAEGAALIIDWRLTVLTRGLDAVLETSEKQQP